MIANVSISEKSFGSKLLYSDLRLSIQAGEKVGLIGRNGVGKSTLFGIMARTDSDYQGELAYRQGLVVAATRQEHHGLEDQSVLEYILGDLPEYAHLKHIIDTYPDTMGDNMKKVQEFTDALSRFNDLGYYTVDESVIRELAAMQIDESKARGKLGNLSGGQKRLAEVVKIMHSNAQLALVDEPTNHMDYIAKSKFIEWLKDAKEAVLVITHDRDVLHEVDRIVEIKDGKAFSYSGNYDAYLKQNAVSTVTKVHDFEVVQRQIENLKDKVVQFRRLKERARDPDTIKQFKRRENEAKSQLAELQAVERPSFWIDRDSAEDLAYKSAESYEKFKAKNIRIHNMKAEGAQSTRLLFEVKDLSLGYDNRALFGHLNLQVRENERVELRGRNGAGKTTLIRAIIDAFDGKTSSTILKGAVAADKTITVGVYEQEVSDKYFDLSLSEAIERMYIDKGLSITTQKVMQLMSDYLFEPTRDGSQPIRLLSGGQKARFQLITMLAAKPQLLILDEPTNHLDLPSVEELENALTTFSGAVLYVSHDDYFRKKFDATVLEITAT